MERTDQERIIMGIDPGTNIMGYGVIAARGNKASMMGMGTLDLRKIRDPYLRLGEIFKKVTSLIEEYLPDEMAIEAPFFGNNVQSMLKLCRAQGVAMAAGINRDIPIREYAPMKVKAALTGQGSASKEQVAGMVSRLLNIADGDMPKTLDATDALAVAYCHFLQRDAPAGGERYRGWEDFIARNKDRIHDEGDDRD